MWSEHETFGAAGIRLLTCSQVGQETEGEEERNMGEKQMTGGKKREQEGEEVDRRCGESERRGGDQRWD